MPGKKESEAVRREQILRAAYEVASQQGVGGLTVRAVAARAKLSHGLVHFHFHRKDALIPALLDWLLETTSVLRIPEDVARLPRAVDRLHELLRREMHRLSGDPLRTRLFLEFWAMGARHASIRRTISAELERYRAGFRTIIEEALESEPLAFGDATPDGLAAVVVSWIHGCAVQAMIDPEHFDADQYLTAVRGLLGESTGAVA